VSYISVGNYLSGLGEDASKHYLKAIDIREELLRQTCGDSEYRWACREEGVSAYANFTGDTDTLFNLFESYRVMANYLEMTGNEIVWPYDTGDGRETVEYRETAAHFHLKAFRMRERIYMETAIAALNVSSELYTYNGHRLITLGKKKETSEYYRKAIDTMTRVFEQTPTLERLDLVSVSNNVMGIHLTELGKMEEACEYYRKAIDAKAQICEQQTHTLSDLSMLYCLMWIHLRKLGKMEEANEYFQKACDAEAKCYKQSDKWSLFSDDYLDRSCMWTYIDTLNDYERDICCLQVYMAKARIFEQQNTYTTLSDRSRAYNDIWRCLRRLGRAEEAEIYFQISCNMDAMIEELEIEEREEDYDSEADNTTEDVDAMIEEQRNKYFKKAYDSEADITENESSDDEIK
jgi:tetratricopeptide (TPR) repeat protein